MRKKDIAFFITHPTPYLSPLFRKLSQNNNINLIVYYFSSESTKEFFDKDFGLIQWDSDLLGGHQYEFIKNNPFESVNFNIIKKLKGNNYDCVIVQGWNTLPHWIVFFTAFILKIPVFLRVETPLNQELLKNKIKLILKSIILKPLFRRVSIFLAIGKQNSDFFKSYNVPGEKIFFSPYAVDNTFFRSRYIDLKEQKQDFKIKYGLNDYKKIILFVGKLQTKKRPLDLIKAFHLSDIKDSCLVFVGEGLLRNELELYIDNHNLKNVFLMGFRNQKELPNFYTIADLFILPSGIGETWGLVINEAMNYNLPIIASKTVGSCDDLIVNNGLTFEEGSIDSLSIKIKEVLSSPKLKYMGDESYNIVQNYSYQATELAIMNIIKQGIL